VNKAYVSVPPRPYYLTPKSARKLDSDDLGGYGSEDGGPSSPTKRTGIHDSVRSSARRTGDRDERGTCNLFLNFSFVVSLIIPDFLRPSGKTCIVD